MPIVYEPSNLASNGKACYILGEGGINVHVDVITRITRGSQYNRTETALERGAALTVHRQRVPQQVTLEVVASDVEPVVGALITGRWELDHASKTLDRLLEAQASDTELKVWTGEEFLRTQAGSQVWVLDNIEHSLEGAETQVLKATLTFGESPRFATQFTNALDNVDSDLADVLGSPAERGRQSTTETSASTADAVSAGAWP